MDRPIYLDHNATTPVHPEILEAMLPYFSDKFGNPSAQYRAGQEAARALETAREQVAAALCVAPDNVFFTSGGTEANNWIIRGLLLADQAKRNHIITSKIEHHAVLDCCRFLEKHHLAEVTYLPVEPTGVINPDEVRKAILPNTLLISAMTANNETGVIQPVEAIGHIARENGIAFHTDAVQALGKMNFNLTDVDAASFSAHKIYAPKGCGALYLRDGLTVENLIYGGKQERDRRAGTENLPAIVGFGKACSIMDTFHPDNVKRLRDAFELTLKNEINEIEIIGGDQDRLGNTSLVCFHGCEAQALLLQLDLRGIYVSSGAACATGSPEPSHVLRAMGLAEENIRQCLRFSFGMMNNEEQVMQAADIIKQLVVQLKN